MGPGTRPKFKQIYWDLKTAWSKFDHLPVWILLIVSPGVHPKLGIKNTRIGSKAPDICLCAHSAVQIYEFEACFSGQIL